MPNTLVHYAAQGLLGRRLWPRFDARWLYLGCLLPDLPWILRRLVVASGLPVDPFDLRLYTMAQASLAGTLLLCAALAALTMAPRLVFVVLGANALAHLLIDACEVKWGNGVHLLAPFSWRMTSFGLVSGEGWLVPAVSLAGAALVTWEILRRHPSHLGFAPRPRRLTAAVALLAAYFAAPLPFLGALQASDSYSVRTLRETQARPGRQVSFDRTGFGRAAGSAWIDTWSGERLRVTGSLPDAEALVSLTGTFLTPELLRVDRHVVHSADRDWPSYLALFLLGLLWTRRPLLRYLDWLHLCWPSGRVERLPELRRDGTTSLSGVRVVGDLAGVPLLKFAAHTGARAVQAIAEEPGFGRRAVQPGTVDLVILGAGVSGVAAALEARRRGLRFELIEAEQPFFTIVNFPRRKPIYTYPGDLRPAGELQFSARSVVKEGLLDELREHARTGGIETRIARAERLERDGDGLIVHLEDGQTVRAHRVIVAIGRSGDFRRLGVSGEEREKVTNRLHDPGDHRGQQVLVVGGGDAAVETAIALAEAGARVTLSHRSAELSRPKPENLERLAVLARDPDQRLALLPGSQVLEIRAEDVVVREAGGTERVLPNDAVFVMIGREAPIGFFRRSAIRLAGELRTTSWLALTAFLLFCTWLYHWKSGLAVPLLGRLPGWLNPDPARMWSALEAAALADPATLLGTLRISASGASFYYTLAYSALVLAFGLRRIRTRATPYVRVQTWTLTAIQLLPLFLLPEIVLPWLGHNGWLDHGWPGRLADALFPVVGYGHGREYWRAYGLVLAWPLNVYNVFTAQPLWGWLGLAALQTFVFIPAIVFFWGKGAYCGWICSCGALAETLGDAHRHQMPHGPGWNRLNALGQAILALAVLLLALRVAGWAWPGSAAERLFRLGFSGYAWTVDLFLAGILGYGLYFWFSGRTWCRFACPLAALMHLYARFSRFRILAEKKKCISCNVCTSVCHQGIDVMSFANRGEPMADPQCVRCSACVASCPTGVLTFGQIDPRTGRELRRDPGWLEASPVRRRELPVRPA